VASRRLRAALPLFAGALPEKRYPTWMKEIRAVTRALGAARDIDVQIEAVERFLSLSTEPRNQPGLRRLLLRLRQQRARLQAPVNAALDHLETSGVLLEMQNRLALRLRQACPETVPSTHLTRLASRSIMKSLEAFLSYEPYVWRPESIEELHAMRIAAKHLRYTLEIFAPIFPSQLKEPLQAIRKVQESLGEIHDADVWEVFLEEFIRSEQQRSTEYFGHLRGFPRLLPGLRAFQEDRRKVRQGEYAGFVGYWEHLSQRGVWDSLVVELTQPIPPDPSEKGPAAPSPSAVQGEA
ncbi:MAG TPA: CHAD domain-containing protein, partial [Anaerolineaceae bacterium]|nr:CHAD domain-containing protein [Anaerolineaceae bacterium]